MIDTVFYFIMVPMVYLAFAWFIVGAAIKILGIVRSPAMPHTLRIFPEKETNSARLAAVWDALTMPTVRAHRPLLWFFLMVFHIGIALLILAHLDLIPKLRISAADSPHMIGNGAIGVALTVSLLYLLFRRFRTPVREFSVPSDYLLLFLIFCLFLTGDVISWGNSWSPDGFVITKQDLGAYLSSLIRFTFEDPRKVLSGSHYPVVAMHVLLANVFLIILPFSKIMHSFFAIPLNILRRV
ncbi:MAG: respiratory nitrate reductase subunit gamma [Desulfomonile tiedjei]|uniref:Respiratory nitrate reductase subunit gamma n=1 Tax=Desulfomonile tiedjei TaxID=2358 RepID=A0A9D6V5Y4_9BACT|nr:respiratory nitrate reductase subunit gamma [Desulfomonile tiedjei]